MGGISPFGTKDVGAFPVRARAQGSLANFSVCVTEQQCRIIERMLLGLRLSPDSFAGVVI